MPRYNIAITELDEVDQEETFTRKVTDEVIRQLKETYGFWPDATAISDAQAINAIRHGQTYHSVVTKKQTTRKLYEQTVDRLNLPAVIRAILEASREPIRPMSSEDVG